MQNVILGTVAAILGSSLFIGDADNNLFDPSKLSGTNKAIPEGKQAVKVSDFTSELHKQISNSAIGSTEEKKTQIIKGLNTLNDVDLVKIAVAHESMFSVSITNHLKNNSSNKALNKDEANIIGRIALLGAA